MNKSGPRKTISLKKKIQFMFRQLAEATSRKTGSPTTFFLSLFIIVLWGISGFYIGFTETWQLIINTGTTILTFLMVILIQNTQYRQDRAIQLKLDEILYGTEKSRNSFLEIEEETDEELDQLKQEFIEIRKKYIEALKDKESKQ